MNIIFVKQYVDKTTFSNPIVIERGEEGVLLDEYNGCIEMTKGFARPTVLEGVPAGCYVPAREDVLEQE